MFTREHIHRFAAILFPDIPVTITLEHLDQYGSEPYEPERERVQMAILQLSGASGKSAYKLLYLGAEVQYANQTILTRCHARRMHDRCAAGAFSYSCRATG